MSAWIQFSAGVGPAECAWAVAKAVERFSAEAEAHGLSPRVVEAEAGPAPGTWRSVLLALDGEGPPGWLGSWLGTVQWVGRSPFRPTHKRRNWFIGVALFEPPDETAFGPGELRFETMRAGGAGGQHQNKTESAVRVTHVPTGTSAIARDGRSQHQNRKLALVRLARVLEARKEAGVERARGDRWGQHQALERGGAVRVYEGPGFTRRG